MYSSFVFYLPEDGECFWSKHVGGHGVYKLISIYLHAFCWYYYYYYC